MTLSVVNRHAKRGGWSDINRTADLDAALMELEDSLGVYSRVG